MNLDCFIRDLKVVLAEVHELTDRNHVLAIGADRFGVYKGYYRIL